jgi:hypothetical protein
MSPRSLPVNSSRGRGAAGMDVIAANAALAERAASFARCARCESRQYKQRLVWR